MSGRAIRAAAVALTAGSAPSATAQDFSEGSQATSWNLYAETPARFEARVVDILCELSGDCPQDCGGGGRQIGLLRAADGVLVFPNKNAEPIFTGAAADLAPYCGQDIVADGLMIDDPELGAHAIYLLQSITPAGDDAGVKANNWSKLWAEAHPDATGSGPWFRRDPAVLAEIEEEGWFGLGPERDAEILKELYE